MGSIRTDVGMNAEGVTRVVDLPVNPKGGMRTMETDVPASEEGRVLIWTGPSDLRCRDWRNHAGQGHIETASHPSKMQ